ncbi:TPM domain-containing protein [Caulobacter segnis]|uniref:TPM domain-containing protein n=1 Tax=Caulobacter segnis TaxID=88688 RepID=UPI00240F1A4F|nr:TPM domain-containing protein [Caulobacter segnis]MDG2521663.1 TPM domain-containing protein [Caulobacter segnis]
MDLSKQDHERIAAAVAAAERTTAGEIYCVLAPEVSDYRETPLVWAAASALVLPALALFAGLRPHMLTDLFGGWTAAHDTATDATIFSALSIYIAVQAAVFVIAALVVSLGPVRRALTPGPLKTARVHQAAMQQFLSHGLHLTQDRTGVLLFASVADHRAEVVADEGIYAKAPPEVWDEVVALLIAGLKRDDAAGGFIAAIERSGQILAEHVPPRGDNPNELPDGLVVLPRPGRD